MRGPSTYYTAEELRAQLPEVGDRLIRVPTLHKSLSNTAAKPAPCTVTYVNKERLWYTVRFDTGFTQSYKVPEMDREVGSE